MEWTSLIAAFYDKEDMATSELNKTVQKVEEVSKKIKNKAKSELDEYTNISASFATSCNCSILTRPSFESIEAHAFIPPAIF
ncbi:hypothetical protein ACTPEF_26580, partial [Clostridioides difficile]